MNKLYRNINTIIWDWNGTLLNDIDICIESINIMLLKRNLKPLDQKVYKNIFTFPVRDYYIRAGFDLVKEDFDVTGLEFIELYRQRVSQTSIQQGANDVLDYLRERNYRQFLVSAMEHDFLTETVNLFGISHYFEHIAGIETQYAGGKLQQAKGIMIQNHINPENTIFIGDTLHDHEVATGAGAQTILISNGHQSSEKLKISEAIVLDDITELIKIL